MAVEKPNFVFSLGQITWLGIIFCPVPLSTYVWRRFFENSERRRRQHHEIWGSFLFRVACSLGQNAQKSKSPWLFLQIRRSSCWRPIIKCQNEPCSRNVLTLWAIFGFSKLWWRKASKNLQKFKFGEPKPHNYGPGLRIFIWTRRKIRLQLLKPSFFNFKEKSSTIWSSGCQLPLFLLRLFGNPWLSSCGLAIPRAVITEKEQDLFFSTQNHHHHWHCF